MVSTATVWDHTKNSQEQLFRGQSRDRTVIFVVNIQEKAQKIGVILDELYPNITSSLYYTDPYTLLVAVVLSAQCSDKKVNEVSPRLFAQAATPQAIIELGVDGIGEIIKPLGLAKSKANNIYDLSVVMVRDYAGRVPRDIKALERLPGVGHKTASVVMSQAFGVPAFAVDTHVQRLSLRWGLSDSKNVRKTEESLKQLYPEAEWSRRHLQFIAFGREHCKALKHVVASCPICSWAADSEQRPQPDT